MAASPAVLSSLQSAASIPARKRPATPVRPALLVYAGVVAITCFWVLSLPLFPSQDGPLHLYYVNVFRQLLTHQHTLLTRTYTIRHLLPPYATYYYGLVFLGSFVSLETADKLFVCGCIALFAICGYVLLVTVSPASRWSPFLLLPVLLNWPTLMGFANFMLSVDFACLALACWCLRRLRPGRWYRTGFLCLTVLMVFTHPVPWLFTVGFAGLDLGLLLLQFRPRQRRLFLTPDLRRDFLTLAIACLPYLYFAHFRSNTQIMTGRVIDASTHAWRFVAQPSYLQRCYQ